MDEVTLSLEPPLRACWMKQGQQKRIPANVATHPTPCRHIFGGYDWGQDTLTWTTTSHKNTDSFIAFLEELMLHRYPEASVILVLDNVSYHKSAPALAAMSLFEERLEVFWLPPYCPELNLIERFWRYLKDQACANHLEDHIDKVLANAEAVLSRQNDLTADHRLLFSKDL